MDVERIAGILDKASRVSGTSTYGARSRRLGRQVNGSDAGVCKVFVQRSTCKSVQLAVVPLVDDSHDLQHVSYRQH